MSRQAWIALVSLLLLAAALRVRYFTGLQIGDDIYYSYIAAERLDGNVVVTNVHETRTGFLLPIMFSYAVFGIGEFQLVLYNLLCSVGIVGVVFFLARRLFGERAGWFSAAVAALHPNLVYYATECHTDIPVAFWQSMVMLLFLSADDEGRPRGRLVLAGLLLGWAYLHKVGAVFLIPFFVGHWLFTGRKWNSYLPMALAALGVFLAELGAFWMLTGNPFERFAQIKYWHSGTYMAEQYTTTSSVLYRLFLELPVRLFSPWWGHNWHGVINFLCLLAGVLLLIRRTPGARLLAGWWATFYILYCFWPSSLSPFLPAFFLFEWTYPVFMAPFACFLGGMLARWRPKSAAVIMVVLGGVSLFCMHRAWTEGRTFAAGPREARVWIEEHKPAHVITDDKTIEAMWFFDDHEPARRYTAFQEVESYEGAVVIVDKVWTDQSAWWARPITVEVKNPPRSWRKIAETRRLVIYQTWTP